jgi:hypothetical protein
MHSNRLFKVITIEHDAYRYGNIYRDKEREILTALGYYLLCADVSDHGFEFEDWWIHPDFFPPLFFQQLASLDLQGKDYMEVMQSIKMLISNYTTLGLKLPIWTATCAPGFDRSQTDQY